MNTTNASDWVHRIAGLAHQGIDRVEQSLSSASATAGSVQSRYGEQAGKAREYVGQVRERAAAQPTQAAALVFATGFVCSRLFMRKPKARVIKVPVYVPQGRGQDAQRWTAAAGRSMDRVGAGAQDIMGKLGAVAMQGIGAAKALAATLPYQARAMSRPVRSAMGSSPARTQAYGEMARSSMQEHPLLGTSLALGAGALLARQLMPDRNQGWAVSSQPRASFLHRGGPSSKESWSATEGPFRFGSAMSSRTVMLSGAGLGLGVLLGAMLMRR